MYIEKILFSCISPFKNHNNKMYNKTYITNTQVTNVKSCKTC